MMVIIQVGHGFITMDELFWSEKTTCPQILNGILLNSPNKLICTVILPRIIFLIPNGEEPQSTHLKSFNGTCTSFVARCSSASPKERFSVVGVLRRGASEYFALKCPIHISLSPFNILKPHF